MVELEHERETAERVISDLDLGARLFELIPALSRSPRAAYIEEVRQCQIFALILWKSYPEPVQREYKEAVNCAKPILIFVKDLAENERRSDVLEKFLDELTGEGKVPSGEAFVATRTVFGHFRKLSELSSALRQSLVSEIGKFYEVPRFTLSREDLYQLGTDIIANAQKRLCIVQRTPALFLGGRDYLAPDGEKIWYEQEFLRELEAWIEGAKSDRKKMLLYLFSPASTRRELDAIRARLTAAGSDSGLRAQIAKYEEWVAGRIHKYKEIESKSGAKLEFLPITSDFSGPMTVGDNRMAIWIIGTDMAVSLSQENDRLAETLLQMLRGAVRHDVPETSILEELGVREASSPG